MSVIDLFEKLSEIMSSGVGRDKMCRVIQYFIMGIIPTLKDKGAHYHDLAERLMKLRSQMSLTRKVIRFGKELPLVVGIRNRLRLHEKDPQRMIFFRTLSDLSLILYFATDHPLYFNNIGFWKYDKKFIENCDYINNVFWLLNDLFDIACTLADMMHLQKEIKALVSIPEISLICFSNRK